MLGLLLRQLLGFFDVVFWGFPHSPLKTFTDQFGARDSAIISGCLKPEFYSSIFGIFFSSRLTV